MEMTQFVSFNCMSRYMMAKKCRCFLVCHFLGCRYGYPSLRSYFEELYLLSMYYVTLRYCMNFEVFQLKTVPFSLIFFSFLFFSLSTSLSLPLVFTHGKLLKKVLSRNLAWCMTYVLPLYFSLKEKRH